jgi:hypothetical protein
VITALLEEIAKSSKALILAEFPLRNFCQVPSYRATLERSAWTDPLVALPLSVAAFALSSGRSGVASLRFAIIKSTIESRLALGADNSGEAVTQRLCD